MISKSPVYKSQLSKGNVSLGDENKKRKKIAEDLQVETNRTNNIKWGDLGKN